MSDIVVNIGKDLLEQNLATASDFSDHFWFWKEISRRKLVKYLEFAVDGTLTETAKNLIYAFTYPGTFEGFVKLCQGLFGMQSIVIIDDQDPAIIEIDVQNASTTFLYALAKNDHTIAVDDDFALATADISKAVSYDPLQFFRNFLTPGRVLRKLNIST